MENMASNVDLDSGYDPYDYKDVLAHFIDVVDPEYSFELGCSDVSTVMLGNHSFLHNVFDSRHEWLTRVEESIGDLESTTFNNYTRIEEVIAELNLFKGRYDLAFIDGPCPDRTQMAQSLIDLNCNCVILNNYEEESKLGYRKIRRAGDYDFRVFNKLGSRSQIAVFLKNRLSSIKVEGHV